MFLLLVVLTHEVIMLFPQIPGFEFIRHVWSGKPWFTEEELAADRGEVAGHEENAEEATAEAGVTLPNARPRWRVLVADETPLIRMVTKVVLERIDATWVVDEAKTSDEVFQMATGAEGHRGGYDLIVMDDFGEDVGTRMADGTEAKMRAAGVTAVIVGLTSANPDHAAEHDAMPSEADRSNLRTIKRILHGLWRQVSFLGLRHKTAAPA
jgi:CheY-like chemotaxis protein